MLQTRGVGRRQWLNYVTDQRCGKEAVVKLCYRPEAWAVGLRLYGTETCPPRVSSGFVHAAASHRAESGKVSGLLATLVDHTSLGFLLLLLRAFVVVCDPTCSIPVLDADPNAANDR